jgi:hypothetical protein
MAFLCLFEVQRDFELFGFWSDTSLIVWFDRSVVIEKVGRKGFDLYLNLKTFLLTDL